MPASSRKHKALEEWPLLFRGSASSVALLVRWCRAGGFDYSYRESEHGPKNVLGTIEIAGLEPGGASAVQRGPVHRSPARGRRKTKPAGRHKPAPRPRGKAADPD